MKIRSLITEARVLSEDEEVAGSASTPQYSVEYVQELVDYLKEFGADSKTIENINRLITPEHLQDDSFVAVVTSLESMTREYTSDKDKLQIQANGIISGFRDFLQM